MKSKLAFSILRMIRLTFSNTIRREMRELWIRKTVSSGMSLGDYYKLAFIDYLHVTKIPKQMEKIIRTTARLNVDAETQAMIVDMGRIARKRQQPLCVVIEEALQRYLDKPENYLGKNRVVPTKLERIK